ncbi:MAG: hypothetical protein AAB582_02085 [Patescibacteria group bacterium]
MNKPLRTLILIVLALVVVGAGAYVFSTKKALSPSAPMIPVMQNETAKTYTSEEYGFSFEYPEGYVVTEREVGDAHRGHYQIMLVEEANATPPEGGEGPIAVTIDVYQNDIDKQPAMHWITTTNIANIKLGDGQLKESTVGGEIAYMNTWSGLYEGKTTTFAHGDDIIAVSTTWMTPDDSTLDVGEQVLTSFRFVSSEAVLPQ